MIRRPIEFDTPASGQGLFSSLLNGLTHTLAELRSLGNKTHRVLLTTVPPKPRIEGQQLRDM